MTGSTSKIVHIPYREAYGPGFEDMDRRVPDITKAGKVFGFKPTRKLEEIIESVISYERKKGAKAAQLTTS
jgi:UDP-glucose 4-epimerase